MQNRRGGWVRTWMVTAALALATVGIALAQAPDPKGKGADAKGKGADTKGEADAKGKAPVKAPKGGLRAAGGAPPGGRRGAVDPFGKGANNPQDQQKAPTWPYHYRFKINGPNGPPMPAVYYPAQRGTAAVVMLVHERGRSARDFEDGIEELKDKGLAAYLQSQGYAVLVVDLRNRTVAPVNARAEAPTKEGYGLVRDLQAAYLFLVDRHNREELNLAKFGVVGLGEGANLVATWAATPGGAVSSEGRISDLGALVLISPTADGYGLRLAPALTTIAPRVPLLLIAGERDAPSFEPVKEIQPTVARQRQSKVELFPTTLHGFRLLRFQPRVVDAIESFFAATIKKVRNEEWEPRYNLTPVLSTDVELVAGKAAPKADEKAAPKADEKAAPKADEKAKKGPAKAGDQPKKAAAKD